jgi:hypothetical protein
MATHSFLIVHEEPLLDARFSLHELMEAVRIETKALTGKEVERPSDVQVYPQNRDLWGTIYANVTLLRNRADEFLSLLEKEFG